MSVPADRKYLESHEWFKLEGKRVTVGITKLAADQLSDITYVELPQVGRQLKSGDVFGEIESVKATSELYTGVSGKVLQVNADLEDRPELVNQEPFGAGWMILIEADQTDEMNDLLTAEQYAAKLPPEG